MICKIHRGKTQVLFDLQIFIYPHYFIVSIEDYASVRFSKYTEAFLVCTVSQREGRNYIPDLHMLC